VSIFDKVDAALHGQDLWGPSVSPYQQRQNDMLKQAEADWQMIETYNAQNAAQKVSKRESDFEKSGLSPARFPEWVKEWHAKNGMDY
jgi:hypothetical protein